MNPIVSNSGIDIFQIISLIGSLSTIVLGVVAIWLALYFYRRSNELNNLITNMLSRIESSSRVAETNLEKILGPVIEQVLNMAKANTTDRIDSLSPQIMQRVIKKLDDVAFTAKTEEEKSAARQAVISELENLLGTFKHDVVERGLSYSTGNLDQLPAPTATGSSFVGWSTANWAAFLRKIKNMEDTRPFLSVKWLRETKFADDPESQEMLQVALDKDFLSEYHIDNPHNPRFPTLACKLNRKHLFIYQLFGPAEVGTQKKP